MQENNKNNQTKLSSICLIAVMAALVFVFTYTFKIPIGNGYTHLGDAFIFLSAYLLGGKKAAFSGALGAALADLLSGYTIWIAPTFISKFLMVAACCLIAEKIFKRSLAGYAIGGAVGMLVHIGAYTLFWYLLYGTAAMLSALPTLAIQTVVGYAGSAVFILALRKSKADKKLQSIAGFNPSNNSEKELYSNEKD